MSDRMQETNDPRYDGIYQRGGAAGMADRVTSPAPLAPTLLHAAERPADPSLIREVGPEAAGTPIADSRRNPFDVWIWVVAAVLTTLGVYLISAPMVYERQYAESLGQMTSQYSMPWFNYTSMAAPPLILLGVATAVVQLFVLSIRHTLRSR
ncbi:hypothetical protein [Arthrobacter sp. NPDC092385]|uniref:hypothetical protein n=1 Tax=Arthrobacter sp. NPDC092385 TaxID=3363943 RepID=UPI0037F4F8AF